MMLKTDKKTYLALTIIAILLGIFSRKIDGIPTFFGDTLYAIMVYFGMRMIFINNSIKKIAGIALVFCFCIEFLQLYRAEWILTIRRATIGHYVLGQGFLWSDLIYYSMGVLIAFFIDSKVFKKNN